MNKSTEINGLIPLTRKELNNTNGGFIWPFVIGVVLYLASEFDEIKDGVQDALAGKEYNYIG